MLSEMAKTSLVFKKFCCCCRLCVIAFLVLFLLLLFVNFCIRTAYGVEQALGSDQPNVKPGLHFLVATMRLWAIT